MQGAARTGLVGGDRLQSGEDAPDAELARRAATGDREAFEEIVHRHGEAVFRYLVRMLHGDVQDAEDALQSAWIKAWLGIDRFRGDSALRTWLFRIAGNEALAARRRMRAVPMDDLALAPRLPASAMSPETEVSALELRRQLDGALAELPWRQRAVWLLREIEGLAYEEIAEVLHTSPTVVRGQLHRARGTLAARMETWR